MSLLAKKVRFSRPKTMATNISHKVQEYRTPLPPYLGIIPKKIQFFTASLTTFTLHTISVQFSSQDNTIQKYSYLPLLSYRLCKGLRISISIQKDMKILGGPLNWASSFSVPKRKARCSQTRAADLEILNLKNPFVGFKSSFLSDTKMGRAE